MILENNIKIKINSKTLKYYTRLGYNCSYNDIIEIQVNELSKGSQVKINVKCDICKKEKKISYKDYNKNISSGEYCCSSKCAQNKIRKNLIKKYNVDNISKLDDHEKKRKETCLIKYGDENYTNREKSKNTTLEKYGVDNISKLDIIKNKVKNTNISKFGYEYYTMNPNFKQEFNDICLKKYNKTNYTKSDDYRNVILNKIKERFNLSNTIKYENNKIILYCDKGHNFEITEYNLYQRIKLYKTEICTICNPLNSFSGKELELLEFIKENYDGEILLNKRDIIKPLELDIYLPELKLAFEFNGLYWHNELYLEKNYHLNKTELCEAQGIQLIHIWEDDWLFKQDIVKSMILNKLHKTHDKIYARKTTIKEINDNKLVREFLEINHIQGFVGSKVKIGLFIDNKLVSLMTFGNRRVAMGKKSTNEGEYELLRFCNKLNTNVVGGASKLFKYFIINYKPNEITTYADRSFSQGKLYETLGFKSQGKTEPNYYYIINGIRKHRFNFRKDILIKQGFDSNKTEHQIMLDRNIFRIYDSGNFKFKINI